MSTVTTLTVHRGGKDPAEIAEKTRGAVKALSELVEVMPYSDSLRHACDLLAVTLDGRILTGRRH